MSFMASWNLGQKKERLSHGMQERRQEEEGIDITGAGERGSNGRWSVAFVRLVGGCGDNLTNLLTNCSWIELHEAAQPATVWWPPFQTSAGDKLRISRDGTRGEIAGTRCRNSRLIKTNFPTQPRDVGQTRKTNCSDVTRESAPYTDVFFLDLSQSVSFIQSVRFSFSVMATYPTSLLGGIVWFFCSMILGLFHPSLNISLTNVFKFKEE